MGVGGSGTSAQQAENEGGAPPKEYSILLKQNRFSKQRKSQSERTQHYFHMRKLREVPP